MSISRAIALTDINNLLLEVPGYIVGNWYLPFAFASVTNGNAPGTGKIALTPVYIKQRCTIDTLGLLITTTQAAGNVQAAIYANNATTGRPTGNALVSTGSMSTTSAVNVSAAASLQLSPGLYWMAVNQDNATSAVRSYSVTSALVFASEIGSATQGNSLNSTGSITALTVTQTFGTWPDITAASFTEVATANYGPLVQFKVASVP